MISFKEFVWIWNRFQGLGTPELHIRMASWIQENWESGERELAILAFRGSGKSTLVGLFCAWLLVRNQNLRILVLAADFSLAKKMVRNAKHIIEKHPFAKIIKPTRRYHWASDQFTVNRTIELRDPSIIARGIGTNITGSRADIVVCDDVEVPNTCDTRQKREQLRARLKEIHYIMVPGGLQLYIGTPHAYDSIYFEQDSKNKNDHTLLLSSFRKLFIPIINECGQSQWDERFNQEKIAEIYRNTGKIKFQSQMMLRPPMLSESRLDPEKMVDYNYELVYTEANNSCQLTLGGRRLVSATCWWDPAFGSPEVGDGNAIAVVFTDECGEYWLHRIRYLQYDPELLNEIDEASQLCRKVAIFIKDNFVPSLIIETNGIGRFLPGLLRQQLRVMGVQCAVIERVTTKSKALRILDAFDAVLASGRLHAHRSVWSTPFVEEMREWTPGSKGRDDGLDAVAGCLASEPVRLSRQPLGRASEAAPSCFWSPASVPVIVDHEFEM